MTGGVATVTVTATGDANYDSIIADPHRRDKIVHTTHDALVPKPNNVFERPSEETTQTALANTAKAILGRIEKKAVVAQSTAAGGNTAAPEYIKYTPSKQGEAYNSGASHRLIKMHEVSADPLEPPKFRHKKVGARAAEP